MTINSVIGLIPVFDTEEKKRYCSKQKARIRDELVTLPVSNLVLMEHCILLLIGNENVSGSRFTNQVN